MIDKRFLFFRTKESFERELNSNNINQLSIVFIEDVEAIWTHNTYFYCKCKEGGSWVLGDKLPIILSRDWDVILLKNWIDTNANNIAKNASDIELIYNSIANINDSVDAAENSIQDNNNTIQAINSNLSNITTNINSLQEDVEQLKTHTPSDGGSDGIKHIILEEDEYNELTVYEDNAIYFVLEPAAGNVWVFGDNLPIYLS